jgi:hypothetical protein
MITDRTITLLQSLLSTKSPTKQLELLQEYCLYEADMGQQSQQIIDLLASYKEAVEIQRQQGIASASKRRLTIVSPPKQSKIYPHPKFFPSFSGKGQCDTCHTELNGSNKPTSAFFHRFGKGKQDAKLYCPVPSCFPDEHKAHMLEDRDYIKTMLKKQ